MAPQRKLDVGQSIPGGYLVGRRQGAGEGAAELIAIDELTAQVTASIAGWGKLANINDGEVLSNIIGSAGPPIGNTVTAVLDHVVGATINRVLHRSATAWDASVPVILSANSSTLPAAPAVTVLEVAGADGMQDLILAEAFGNVATPSVAAVFGARRARGTAAAPSALLSGDLIGGLLFGGYGTTGYSSTERAGFGGQASENWTDTAQGARLLFQATPAGSVTPATVGLVQEGMQLGTAGTATGGDKGVGTINVSGGYYVNGVLVTDTGITQLTSDVTAGPGSGSQVATIAANAVTNAKAAQMAAHTFKGNNTGSTANALDLTATQLTAELDVVTTSVKGLAPTLPNDATKFLNGTGGYTVPPGTGPTTIAGDTDVNISGAANNDFFQYQTSDNKWHNRTPTQATATLDVVTTSVKGLAPTLPNNATKFLDGTGAYTSPAGGGGGIGGLWSGAMQSPVPSQSNTGLSTWYNQVVGATVTDAACGITVYNASQGSSNKISAIQKSSAGSGTAQRYTALIARTASTDNFTGWVFGWSDGTKAQVVSLNGSGTGLVINNWTNATSYSSTGLSATRVPLSPIWIQLYDDATNIIFAYSYDGVNWVTLYSVARASGFLGATGYTKIIFGVNAYDALCYASMLSWLQGS